MCDYLTVLARASEYRVIAQCEHGALHVSWDISTIRLRPNDFMTLAQFLNHCQVHANAPLVADGWCQLSRDDRGAVRLWIGQVGLALVASDIAGFIALIDQAAKLLRNATAHPSSAPETIWNCPVVVVNPAVLVRN